MYFLGKVKLVGGRKPPLFIFGDKIEILICGLILFNQPNMLINANTRLIHKAIYAYPIPPTLGLRDKKNSTKLDQTDCEEF
jgi:hypothetical protein